MLKLVGRRRIGWLGHRCGGCLRGSWGCRRGSGWGCWWCCCLGLLGLPHAILNSLIEVLSHILQLPSDLAGVLGQLRHFLGTQEKPCRNDHDCNLWGPQAQDGTENQALHVVPAMVETVPSAAGDLQNGQPSMQYGKLGFSLKGHEAVKNADWVPVNSRVLGQSLGPTGDSQCDRYLLHLDRGQLCDGLAGEQCSNSYTSDEDRGDDKSKRDQGCCLWLGSGKTIGRSNVGRMLL
mmetsp:Transcript_1740/g.3401  ORF Transcript_1740/g.3401 Transcript_1740/m.3401 type:complete len:235 (-) Transcript_1740:148-852(-)